MQFFEFDNGNNFTANHTNVTNTTTVLSTENNDVNFTWSSSSPTNFGTAPGGIVFLNITGITPDPDFNGLGAFYNTTQSFSGWQLTLDVAGGTGATGTPGTQFGGNVAIDIALLDSLTGSIIFDGTTPVTRALTTTGVYSATGQFTSIKFTLNQLTNSPIGGLRVSSLSAEINCFCRDTQISTPDGPKPVQELEAGDEVELYDGRVTHVRWLGRQTVDTQTANPAMINPVCISKGSLGCGLPVRDLWVSKDHAIAIDGLLINAGALVNGTTIYQERDVSEDFTYYHIETDAHELILAEGVAAETFVDYTDRDAFENGHQAPNRVIPEMPLPRISSARLVPDHIKRRLHPIIAAE